MSSEYYFKQWKRILQKLEDLTRLDIQYQDTKAHDNSRCDASLRLSGILGCYIACYNQALECYQQNLQVQKTEDLHLIVKSIAARILELKEQLRKLEGCYYQFLCGGLIYYKLTPYDTELNDVLDKQTTPDNIKRIIQEALEIAQRLKKQGESDGSVSELINDDTKYDWWNNDDLKGTHGSTQMGINIGAIYEVKEEISEETLNRRRTTSLIQAHERSRQFIQKWIMEKEKRKLWEKELKGTLNPPARLDLREKGAKIIQKVLRCYFRIKRKRIKDCMYDEIIGMHLCEKIDNKDIDEKEYMYTRMRSQKYIQYFNDWTNECRKIKNNFINKRSDDITDDFRDYIREWFRHWFEEVKFFLDIPKVTQGGLSKIMKEELPLPHEWLEDYNTYMEQKKANKNKTTTELKYEKIEAKREEMLLKKEEIRKQKREAQLLKKMMKNPKMHPGYFYPISKKVHQITEAIEEYKKKWIIYDELDTKQAREGFLKEIDMNNIYAQVKEDVLAKIDNDMREGLKLLKQALKEDYEINEEVMPENIKQKQKRVKKARKIRPKDESIVKEQLTDLAIKGILVEYPITRFDDFQGECNFAGDDLKCNLRRAQPLRNETLSIWWERCRELIHGCKRILIVGSKDSGKSVLVHAMASVNEATLFDINLLQLYEEPEESLKKIVSSLIICAKATQPSVIYIRHVHRLYFRKDHPNEVNLSSSLLKKLILKRFFKKNYHSDNITIIGSCVDPWLTKSKRMLKRFPNVVMIPPTSYTTTHLLLQKWVSNNRIIPNNLDTHSLARVLQSYPFGHLKRTLDGFLSPDRIVKIAAYGLKSNEIFEYFLQNDIEKVDYDKYTKWYSEKTQWGVIETKHLEEQIEFKHILDKFKEKEEKKSKKH